MVNIDKIVTELKKKLSKITIKIAEFIDRQSALCYDKYIN